MNRFRKILVANRGEIAVRVMQTCKRLGIQTVAVYSEADRKSRHVRMADEAFCLGPGPSSQSYLLGDDIIQICLDNKVDAIHPGYGFLSENAGFARKLADNKIVLIGPSAESMEIMGSKLTSKEAVATYDVPMVPGVNEAVEDIAEAKRIARGLGFPVLIKASAGGGGKGMRVVENEGELEQQMKTAISEAISSFGDGAVFIERFVQNPRHIEIQILGDQHGSIVHLFERECSIQRRHQKLVEEAPSSVVGEAMRAKMGQAAIDVARSCSYYGAGTVEFLVDENMDFFFLEMNTRLQVEHPVTEMITGLDLVEQQIRIAEGNALAFKQDDININGHAVELRVCAEDPLNNFLPNIGQIEAYEIPVGDGIRVDDFVEKGYEIPLFYDNLIAKLVVWGKTRTEAIEKMKEAISHYRIEGLATTLGFGDFVMSHPAFLSGQFDTQFVPNYFTPEAIHKNGDKAAEVASLLSVELLRTHREIVLPKTPRNSPWYQNRGDEESL